MIFSKREYGPSTDSIKEILELVKDFTIEDFDLLNKTDCYSDEYFSARDRDRLGDNRFYRPTLKDFENIYSSVVSTLSIVDRVMPQEVIYRALFAEIVLPGILMRGDPIEFYDSIRSPWVDYLTMKSDILRSLIDEQDRIIEGLTKEIEGLNKEI